MSKAAEDPGVVSEEIKQHFHFHFHFGGRQLINESQGSQELNHTRDTGLPPRKLAPLISQHNGGEVYLYNFTKTMKGLEPPFGNYN